LCKGVGCCSTIGCPRLTGNARSMERFLTQVGPWSDAILSVNVVGYAVPIRRAD
jgi:hypothetical protein